MRYAFVAALVLPRMGWKARTKDILTMKCKRSKINSLNCSILRYLDGSRYLEGAQAAIKSGSLCEHPSVLHDFTRDEVNLLNQVICQ